MKTVSDMALWCQLAAERYGDPAIPVGEIFARYSRTRIAENELLDICLCAGDGGGFELWFGPEPLPITIVQTGPMIDERGELAGFAAVKITDGVWSLAPSLNIPGFIHAFLVVYDVPTPAPWEAGAGHECEGCKCTELEPCTTSTGPCSWAPAFRAVGRWVCSRCALSMMRHKPPEASS